MFFCSTLSSFIYILIKLLYKNTNRQIFDTFTRMLYVRNMSYLFYMQVVLVHLLVTFILLIDHYIYLSIIKGLSVESYGLYYSGSRISISQIHIS